MLDHVFGRYVIVLNGIGRNTVKKDFRRHAVHFAKRAVKRSYVIESARHGDIGDIGKVATAV